MYLHGYSNGEYDVGGDDDNVTLISKVDVSHPLHLHPNDYVAINVVSVKLKGNENYQVWSCAMLLALEGKNKTGFIDGSCRRSNTNEVLGRKSDRVNVMVLRWILNSISEELFLGPIFSKRAKHVWDELKEKLNALWKQFDALIELPRCTCHVADDFKKHNQLMNLMQFFMGLDDHYMQIRSSILSREVLPDRSHTSAFSATVPNRGNFQRSQVFNNFQRPSSIVRPNDNRSRRTVGGSNLICENCGFNGHTIDRCFKTIGYPPDFGKKKAGQNFKGKNVSNNVVRTSFSYGFSDEQLSTLISLIKENSVNGKGVHANMAGTVLNKSHLFNKNFEKFFCSNSMVHTKLETMGVITDSRANQHITFTDKFLVNVIDISYLKNKVSHPNGTEAFITKIRNMPLTDYLTLFDVLVVPEYCVSLMSVHKVARDNKLVFAFDELKCYILNQDLKAGKVLGTGRQFGGLYYFDGNLGSELKSSYINNVCFLSMYTCHCRLGHPADQVLNVLRPNLLFENDKSGVMCETCQRAKQTREPFPLSDHVSTELGLNNEDFFNLDGSIDHSEIPYDDEKSDPSPNGYGTPSSHSGSTSDTHNENKGRHSLGSDAAASEDE
ncbi:ribonuclease H-like domain-containing protein [Tanacetum coccineum]